MFAFALVVIIICFVVWYWVKKHDHRSPDFCTHHAEPEKTGGIVSKDQSKDQVKAAQKQAVALPAAELAAVTTAAVPSAASVPLAVPPVINDTKTTDRRVSERWRDWLALTTVIIAVMAAVMTLEVSRYSTLAVLSNGKESNTWAIYQSKSVKEHTYQISKAALELQLGGIPGILPEAADNYKKTIKAYDEEIKRYEDEKEEISEEAKLLGKNKDRYYKLTGGLTNALAFLQVSIVLSAVATMMRKRSLWYVSLSMLVGWAYFLVTSF